MSIAIMEREEATMTDYQFRSIIKMVLAIASNAEDLDKVVEALKDLLPENDPGRNKDNE